MIITCPYCQTRYQVALDAIGAAGRQVQCASCAQAWTATPVFPQSPEPFEDPDPDEAAFSGDRDALFTEGDEMLLDAAFESQELRGTDAVPGGAVADPGRARARHQALAKRRADINKSLPMARLRRIARWTVATLLVLVLALGIGLRTEIVRVVPELDRLYRAFGLGTNVIGLDFADVSTLRTTRDGAEVLAVTAQVVNATSGTVAVPPVLVTLLSAEGEIIYEWSVNPARRAVEPGERLAIETQLTAPPAGVGRIRLTFVTGQNPPGPGGTTQ